MIKSIITAFSMYSKIPMPRLSLQEEDMKHAIVFLPWIGAVIGLLIYGCSVLFPLFEIPVAAQGLLYTAIPLLLTGGFHFDGFMDTKDALCSYKSKEEKLEILKDPHIGAFAVIHSAICGLLWVAGMYIICHAGNEEFLVLYCLVFPLARSVCGFLCLVLKPAKNTGMLHMETKKATKADAMAVLGEAILVLAVIFWRNLQAGVVFIFCCACFVLYYKQLCEKQFGGVTGDTAGYFIVVSEEILVAAIAVLSLV